MSQRPTPANNTRTGFCYFPDTLHYRESDLDAWLPELKALGASWLTLIAPENRAIPERFIRGLINANIEPILHFHLSAESPPTSNDLATLLKAYESWGVNYITLFNRPNCHDEWAGSSWARQDLVERFLDLYLPLAETVCNHDMYPVFPPLEPGGDYWDTAFLRSALQGIQRRGHERLLEKLSIGAYAWTDNLPINFGAGGPERWPGARPYFTPPGEEDHMSFRIFDWYSAISQAVLGNAPPILILGGGARPGDSKSPNYPPVGENEHSHYNLQIARLMNGDDEAKPDGAQIDPVPDNVLTCNFYLLAASENNPAMKSAWYRTDGTTLPVVQNLQAWRSEKRAPVSNESSKKQELMIKIEKPGGIHNRGKNRTIKHYVLIPSYEWGVADWHLDVTRDFVKKHKATVGFSIEEAAKAERVTVIGGENTFSQEIIQMLITTGCEVMQVTGDGTEIASILETL